jgi:hypothetical protein
MNVSDEIRKSLSDPKPFYALAGAGDLAAEKLRDAPERLRDTPALLAEAGATLTTIANKIAAEAPERIAKVTSTVQDVAGKGARPDTQALRGAAQTVALQQVGRLLEAAGKAVETYDELAERGKVVVERYTGGKTQTVPGDSVNDNGPVSVIVEQVTDEDELEDVPVETAEEAAEVFEAAAEAEAEQEAQAAAAKPKPAAKKTTTPRKRAATAPKTPRASKTTSGKPADSEA